MAFRDRLVLERSPPLIDLEARLRVRLRLVEDVLLRLVNVLEDVGYTEERCVEVLDDRPDAEPYASIVEARRILRND